MNVVILVPRRDGQEHRDRLWRFCRAWWSNDHPDWPIIEGHHDVGPFNRAAAINAAAAAAGDWDVAVIIDSDVLVSADRVRWAVQNAFETNHFSMPHDERVMLTERGTEKVLGGYRGSWDVKGILERTYKGECSCAIAVSRKLWDAVGGFDEGFSGWGWEDVAFVCAAETMTGDRDVAEGRLYHLWHPTSYGNNPKEPTFIANKERADRYIEARYKVPEMQVLIDEAAQTRAVAAAHPLPERPVGLIPKILHRTVPAGTSDQVERWWDHFQQLHPGWEFRTYREPLDPAAWPLTGDLFDRCANGAQKAGLIRLEALVRFGGVYVDSDCEPFRSFDPLLSSQAFAAWEDETTIPDAVIGSTPGHDAFVAILAEARRVIESGGDAWQSGPGLTTKHLQDRSDVLLLPPGAFYPYHYLQKGERKGVSKVLTPWAFCAHHWAGSWLNESHRRSIEARQR